MHQRADGLEGVMLGYPLMFTPQGALGMMGGYAGDRAAEHITGKTFNQLGREYISPLLEKAGMASDITGNVGGFVGDMMNPGYWINVNGFKPFVRGFNNLRNNYSIGLPARTHFRIANEMNNREISNINTYGILRRGAYKNVAADPLPFEQNGPWGSENYGFRLNPGEYLITEKPGMNAKFKPKNGRDYSSGSGKLKEEFPYVETSAGDINGIGRAEDFEYWKQLIPRLLYKRKDFNRTSELQPGDPLWYRESPTAVNVEDFPTNNAYRITDVNELADIAESGKVRAMPKGKTIEGATQKFVTKSGRRFSIEKMFGNSHGGKAFSKGEPWKGTTTSGTAQRAILAYPGEDVTWRVGHHGDYSPETAWSEINHGAGLWKPFDASGNTSLDASKILPYIQWPDGSYHPMLLH